MKPDYGLRLFFEKTGVGRMRNPEGEARNFNQRVAMALGINRVPRLSGIGPR
jgi:hypothetical protein